MSEPYTWDSDVLRQRAAIRDRYAELLAHYEECLEDPDSVPTDPARYVLIEESRYDEHVWITTFGSMADAAEYHDTQEYPEDWTIVRLVDLVTGQEFEPVTRTTFTEREEQHR